jgi:hypothetical protein
VPVTLAEAKVITADFAREYRGALNLAYQFRDTAQELYGPRASGLPQDARGGYVCRDTTVAGRVYPGRVDVILQRAKDGNDLRDTLRHEVLGHYGSNTFSPTDKRALLDGITAASNEPTLKPLWDVVNANYAGRSASVRAEEVFALRCETIHPGQHKAIDQVQQRGQQSFTETCINRVRPMSRADLDNIAFMVAQGIHDRSRVQQTFPVGEFFRLAPVEHVREGPREESRARMEQSAKEMGGIVKGIQDKPLPGGLSAVVEQASQAAKPYVGKVVALTEHHALQQIGANKFIVHERGKSGPQELAVGKCVTIAYGQVKDAPVLAKSRDKGPQR